MIFIQFDRSYNIFELNFYFHVDFLWTFLWTEVVIINLIFNDISFIKPVKAAFNNLIIHIYELESIRTFLST